MKKFIFFLGSTSLICCLSGIAIFVKYKHYQFQTFDDVYVLVPSISFGVLGAKLIKEVRKKESLFDV